MLCLIHIQPRLPFLVCGRLLLLSKQKRLVLLFLTPRRWVVFLLPSDGTLLYFPIQLGEVFTQGLRKDITKLNVVKRISSISAALFAETSLTKSRVKLESKYLKISHFRVGSGYSESWQHQLNLYVQSSAVDKISNCQRSELLLALLAKY